MLSNKEKANLIRSINALIRADVETDEKVHDLAVKTLQHAGDTGDFTLFARLVGNVKTAGGEVFERGLASRRAGLIAWAADYSPIRVNGDNVMGLLKPTAKTFTPFNIGAAKANPFWTIGEERDRREKVRPVDSETIRGRVSALAGMVEKAKEKGILNDDEAALLQLAKDINAYAAQRMRELNLNPEAAKQRRESFQDQERQAAPAA